MADTHSKETRSYNMSRIRSKDTRPEMLVRRFLFSKGFRYRLHDSRLPGKPDLVLLKYKTVILIHGCFWHGHEGCRYAVVPKTRTQWWADKIARNTARDTANQDRLAEHGWQIVTVWECELKREKINSTLDTLLTRLQENLVHAAGINSSGSS